MAVAHTPMPTLIELINSRHQYQRLINPSSQKEYCYVDDRIVWFTGVELLFIDVGTIFNVTTRLQIDRQPSSFAQVMQTLTFMRPLPQLMDSSGIAAPPTCRHAAAKLSPPGRC